VVKRTVTRLSVAVASAGLVLAGCAVPDPTSGAGDVLFVTTRTGVVALDGGSGRTILDSGYAAHSADWTHVFSTETDARFTRVVRHDLTTNARREVARVPGSLAPRVVSRSGELVAMTEPHMAGTSAWNPVRKRRTEMTVIRLPGQIRRFDLSGNFEPEAFTADDRTLVLVEYLPPTRPDRYRLRELDLVRGKVSPLGARLKLLAPGEMRATGRTQVAAPDGGALYTLYARQEPNLTHAAPGTVATPVPIHAFVHVLDLVQGFAHCVDLPDGFGAGPSAVGVPPGGASLFVIDGGRVVVVDTRSLRLTRTAPIRLDRTSSLSAAAQGGRYGAVFVGAGTEVVVLDQATLRVTRRYSVGGDVTGVALGSNGRSLYVALEDEVTVINAATGTEIRTLYVPGLTGISAARSFGGPRR
jgi:hypothetical protein